MDMGDNTYKISVIVPVYNVAQYVEKCARSLFLQTMEEGVEFIFVDDASPDDSIARIKTVLQLFPNRINHCQFIKHSHNRGLTAARNTGLLHSKGEFIIHTDSDDWMEVDMLKRMYDCAMQEDSDLVYCDFVFRYSNCSVPYQCPPWTADRVSSLKSFIRSDWTVIWNILAKRKLYEKYGLKSLESISFYEDFNLSSKLFLVASKVSYVNIPLHNYNQTNVNSIMHKFSSKYMTDEINGCLDAISFYTQLSQIKPFEDVLSYRLLKAKKGMLLKSSEVSKYSSIYPDCHKYIFTCPYYNRKIKFMAWCATHGLLCIDYFVIFLRRIFKR